MPVDDPKDLDRVDQEIHINELKAQVDKLAGGEGNAFVSDDCPPEIAETFLQNIVDYETAPVSTSFEELQKAGIELPPPESLSDEQVTAKLWEAIHALARHSTYLTCTDHLSDRQLYEHLWSDVLREAGPMMPPGSGWVQHIDILGGCSEEDIRLYLKYYADEEWRQHWLKEWPNDEMPPHEDPPYDRDRLLPQDPMEPPPGPIEGDGLPEV